MSEKFKFAIDIDGVACAHALSICERINSDYSLSASPEDITTWDHDFGPITFKQAVEKYYPDNEFIASMKVTLGFKDFFNEIKKSYTAVFATNRKHSQEATLKWVKENFGKDNQVYFLNDKTDLLFDYLIDDYPGHVIAAAKFDRKAFLFSQPWNISDQSEVSKCEKVKIVQSFDQVLENL